MILVPERGSHGKAWVLQGDVMRVFPERGSLGGAGAVWSCGMGGRVQRVCATTVSGGVLCGWMSSVVG